MTELTLGFVYTFPAVIDNWYDGDTPIVHRGTKPGEVVHGEHVRVEGINAPELYAPGGKEARAYALTICPAGTIVTLVASRKDKYGRLLAKVILPNGGDYGTLRITAGHAVSYLA